MPTETVAVSLAEGLTSDERWTAWMAKGVEHDRKIRQRAIGIAAAFAAGTVPWVTSVLLR